TRYCSMSLIQLIILLFLAFSFLMVLLVMKGHLAGRLFFIVQFIVGALFVVFPDLSSQIGKLLGVGRGTDLVLYFLVVLFYMTVLLFIAAMRRLERRQTIILRQLALQNAIDNTRQTQKGTSAP
ncbi:MAG: DUF2304 domain-containing protein, partial [Victivallales bacterium]|nr:DUF2304 domain-containing protein [Victivallales bacterium]